MAILAECPICRKKQAIRNKRCPCGEDLDRAKKSKRVKYWISIRLPGGKQRREPVGYSIEEARDAHGKRRVQKREKRIFDILPESKMTFSELAKWYLEARKDDGLKSLDDIEDDLNNFNVLFGDMIVADIRLEDLERYKAFRRKQGRALSTIDQELRNVKTMMIRADDNDLIGGHVLKPFRRTKRLHSAKDSLRTRTLTLAEYEKVVQQAPEHIKGMIVVCFNTGMRQGEVRGLKWSEIDREKGFIRLPKNRTKEKRPKSIPINRHVAEVFQNLRVTGHDFVFLHRGKAIRHKCIIRSGLLSACKKAGIVYGQKETGGITFHDLRRTVKTLMVEAGIDKVYRDTILGHSLRGMDAHYIMPSDEALKAAMDKYTAFIDAKLEAMKAEVGRKC